MENVMISIKGMQSSEDSREEDAIELVTDGKYSFTDKEICFSYQESELTGLEGTETTFKILPELVMLTRVGKLNTHMVFQPGRKHNFLYDTPYGTITMGVNTSVINCSLDENGGELKIFYSIDMDNSPVGRNAFIINIRKANNLERK